MAVQLRHYQDDIKGRVYSAWYEQGHRNVLAIMPTGAGKTKTFTKINKEFGGYAFEIAHRAELVSQIAMAAAEDETPHRIIAPPKVRNLIIAQQVRELGRHYVDAQAPLCIAGVDTLIRRQDELASLLPQIKQWTIDEAHHVQEANKWGQAIRMLPTTARGLGVTATPIRADNRSLHHQQGGAFETLIQGVDMRWLINEGYLCDYRVIDPGESIDTSEVNVTSTGDFSKKKLSQASEKSSIVGDVVKTYLQHTPGKRAICFAVDVKESEQIAANFRANGVRAVALDGNTNDAIRDDAVTKFRRGDIDVLVNVDLFGEGFDVPAVEVVIMARPTMSFGLFVQMFGRALRPLKGKQFGIIIDHVGNVRRMAKIFGLPDTPRRWQLLMDAPGKKAVRDPNLIPMGICEGCGVPFESTTRTCPMCGHYHAPEDRSKPAAVDGILHEMSPALLEELRMMKAEMDSDFCPVPNGAEPHIAAGIRNRFNDQKLAQMELRAVMETWGGIFHAAGESDERMQARFFHRFNIDVMTAQALKAKKARELANEIRVDLENWRA